MAQMTCLSGGGCHSDEGRNGRGTQNEGGLIILVRIKQEHEWA